MEIIAVAVGLMMCYGVWPAITWWLDRTTEGKELPAPDDVSQEIWLELVRTRANAESDSSSLKLFWRAKIITYPLSATVWLGILERVLSYGAILGGVPIAIAGWLAFKVASKWQVWANVVQVPKETSSNLGKTEVGALIARHRWGSYVLMRFLLGTLSNILVGAALAFVVKYLAFSQ